MFLKYNFPALVWAMFITILSFIPVENVPGSGIFGDVPFVDKIVHLLFYGIFAFLLAYGFRRQYTFDYLRFNPLKNSFLTAVVLGIIIEVLQELLFDYRSFEWLDILANTIGALIGTFVFIKLYHRI